MFVDKIKSLFVVPSTHYDELDPDWADNEIKKQADYLTARRKEAIEYLGEKWILRGGEYTRSNVVLGQK